MDIHKAKGLRVQKLVVKALRETGYAEAVRFTDGIADEVARESRLEQARRIKKAKRHARNMDLFNSSTCPEADKFRKRDRK